LQKTAAYMTEAYLLSRADPPVPPFQYAFGTDVPFFPWLEGEGAKQDLPVEEECPVQFPTSSPGSEPKKLKPPTRLPVRNGLRQKNGVDVGPGEVAPAAIGLPTPKIQPTMKAKVDDAMKKVEGSKGDECPAPVPTVNVNPNKYRLERFGAAMQGTGNWEVPGAVLQG
jgi:hypothetical protein